MTVSAAYRAGAGQSSERAQAPRSVRGLFQDVPLPVLLLVISFCLPPEVSVEAGPLRLSPCRIILLLSFIPSLAKVAGSPRPLGLVDYFMILHGAWSIIALVVSMGAATAVETGGIYMVETVGAYMLARAHITRLEQIKATARLIVGIITVLCAAAFIESITAVHFIRDMFKAVLGGPGAHDMDQRMGLERAFTSFEHPILFGTFAASGFSMAYYILGEAKLKFHALVRVMLVGLACFFSMSGGPFVALFFQGFLIGWDRITRGISLRWAALAAIFAGIWFMLSLASNRSPVLLFVSYLTFSAQSSYNRVNIWIYGTAEVGRHPIFGIGLNDWIRAPWMSDSMDTFWLLTTVRFGLPSVIFLILVILITGITLNSRRTQSLDFKQATKAWMVTMAGLCLAALTVHFWNALMMEFFFLIGVGAAMAQLPAGTARGAVPQFRQTTHAYPRKERADPWF